MLVLILLLSCCDNLRRQVPFNFLALGLFVSIDAVPARLKIKPLTRRLYFRVYLLSISIPPSDRRGRPDARLRDHVSRVQETEAPSEPSECRHQAR